MSEQAANNTLAGNLRILRQHNNLSIADVGRKVGVSRQAAQFFEAGRLNPSPSTLNDLAEFYQVDPAQLLNEAIELKPRKLEKNQLGENLRVARLRAELNQDEAAEAIGICQPALSAYELGKHEPGIYTMLRAAHAYDTTLSTLLEGVDR